MKKKLVGLLVGLMVVSLVGCGNQKEETKEEVVTEAAQSQDGEVADEDKLGISELNIEEYVTLNDYKNMTVEVSKASVDDESVENYITSSILTAFPITDREVREGDTVTIDFEGKKDGVAFAGGTSTGYELTIGSHQFIDGFEDGLIGVMPGETVDLDLTFPEQYQSEELAGQAVVFTVTVHNILADTDYENVTPEQLAAMQLSFTTKEELWAAAEDELKQLYEDSYQDAIVNAAIAKVLEESTIENVPAYLVEDELNAYLDYLNMVCPYYFGVDLETYVANTTGMTLEEYKDVLYVDVEDEIKQSMAIQAIAKAEGLIPDEAEIMSEAEVYCAENDYESVESLFEEAGKDNFAEYVKTKKVMEYLQSNVTVVDVPVE